MAGKATRNKVRRGQQEFANLLRSLDWSVAELNAGGYVTRPPSNGRTDRLLSLTDKGRKALEVANAR